MPKMSYRRLFAWAVLCCTLSALCGLGRLTGLAILVGCVFSCPLIACWWQAQSAQSAPSVALNVIIGRLLLMLLPFFSFMYSAYVGEFRTEDAFKKHARRISTCAWFNQSRQPTVVECCGKKLVINVSVERILKQQTPVAQIILADCSSMSFPEERPIDGRVCFVFDDSKMSADSFGNTLIKISVGDSIAVACYLRSGRFSVIKNTNVSVETCAYLEQHKKNFDVFAFVDPHDVRVLPKPNDIAVADLNPFIVFCREQIFDGHAQNIGPEKGALLTSMVLGQNAVDLPKSIIDSFRNSGLSHVVAASGFNLTVVILVTYWLMRPLNLPTNHCEYGCLLMIIVYVALAGLSASVARAALMSSFVLLSRVSQRRTRITSALAAALFVTWLPSPQALLDVGLQLSYAATMGVMTAAKAFADLLNSRPNYFSKLCAETFSVTVIAQLSVLPIQVYYFGTLGLTFLPANLLIVPLVAPITGFGFIGSLLILLASISPYLAYFALPLVNCIDFVLQFLLTYMILLTGTLGDLQWAQFKIAQPSFNSVAAYYACIAVCFYLLRFPDKKFVALTLAAIALALICLSII